jgi:hypothetical protein
LRLHFSIVGTLENPIIVNGAGDEQYAGCTGYPADSHIVNWLTVSIFVLPGPQRRFTPCEGADIEAK